MKYLFALTTSLIQHLCSCHADKDTMWDVTITAAYKFSCCIGEGR